MLWQKCTAGIRKSELCTKKKTKKIERDNEKPTKIVHKHREFHVEGKRMQQQSKSCVCYSHINVVVFVADLPLN